ncbi:hypothetical protein [Streptomyces inhibens]|nr:hypothetical protein [Streptomyces inhibens]UKY54555.1 hypothetical protein KI385_40960 [Streptomyces inhibens]
MLSSSPAPSHCLAALLEAAALAAAAPVEVLEAINLLVPDGLLILDRRL